MKYSIAMFLLAPLFVVPAWSAENEDPDMIVMSGEIHADGELIAKPVVAFEPGMDASMMLQGNLRDGHNENLVLKLGFHPIHVHEKGPELLLDFDFGQGSAEHVEASHLYMNWSEPYELVLDDVLDALEFRIVMTPTLVKRSEFLRERNEASD